MKFYHRGKCFFGQNFKNNQATGVIFTPKQMRQIPMLKGRADLQGVTPEGPVNLTYSGRTINGSGVWVGR